MKKIVALCVACGMVALFALVTINVLLRTEDRYDAVEVQSRNSTCHDFSEPTTQIISDETSEVADNMELHEIENEKDDSTGDVNKIRIKQVLIGDDDPGDIPVEYEDGKAPGDYVEFIEPRYRTHPITGEVKDTVTGEIISLDVE